MKLNKLTIHNFKNLQDFSIAFDTDALTTVLVGRNGTGKSNLIEALVLIFRDLDLGNPPSFAYQLSYRCRDRIIEVDADPTRATNRVKVTVDNESLSYTRFVRQTERLYLPHNVFGYYSGFNDRLESHFERHQERF